MIRRVDTGAWAEEIKPCGQDVWRVPPWSVPMPSSQIAEAILALASKCLSSDEVQRLVAGLSALNIQPPAA